MKTVITSLVILVCALAVTLAAPPVLSSGQDLLSVKSSLAGRVLPDHLVKEGDQVDSGQPLVYVRTALTGTVSVAARAPHGGTVREVAVKPGQHVERGDVVVRLQPNLKNPPRVLRQEPIPVGSGDAKSLAMEYCGVSTLRCGAS